MNTKTILKRASLLLVVTALCITTGAPAVLAAAGVLGYNYVAQHIAKAQRSEAAMYTVDSIGDLVWGDGEDNMGGIRTQAYLCLHSDVEEHRAPATRSAATSLGQLATISEDLGFKEGKGWKKCYTTEDKGFTDSVMQGERDGRSWITKVQLHFPGNGARIIGLMRLIQNAGCYGLVKDAEGSGRLIGSEHYPAKVDSSTITTGTASADLKGVTFVLSCSSRYPAPICSFEPELEDDSN